MKSRKKNNDQGRKRGMLGEGIGL
jgi:hypothetical protein